jgi:hypothetical protein
MRYQGFFKILMITLISSKKLGGYKIMSHTVKGVKVITVESQSTLLAQQEK